MKVVRSARDGIPFRRRGSSQSYLEEECSPLLRGTWALGRTYYQRTSPDVPDHDEVVYLLNRSCRGHEDLLRPMPATITLVLTL